MGNKACNERYVKQCQQHHKQQLATVKSVIDNRPPKTIKTGALTTNAKKQQIMVSVWQQHRQHTFAKSQILGVASSYACS